MDYKSTNNNKIKIVKYYTPNLKYHFYLQIIKYKFLYSHYYYYYYYYYFI